MRNGSLALALAAALGGCTEAQPCPEPLEVCGGVCVDTLSEVEHCGACSRRCAAGFECLGGDCVSGVQVPCAGRTGGAWVTLETCGQSVKAWIDAVADGGGFIPGAEALVSSGPPPYPVFEVSDGTDCDAQWTWHVEPATARLEPDPVTVPAGCGACPGDVEASKGTWIGQQWCPGSGGAAARLLVVERSP